MIKKIFITNRNGLKICLRLNINEANTKLVFLEQCTGGIQQ